MEVYRGIDRARVIARRVANLGFEALETGLRLDERGIDGEMFFGQQALMVCLQYHLTDGLCSIVCSSRRLRFFVKVVASKLGCARFLSRNQRKSKT